ncbi:MAG: hypothetical protein IH946_02210 [Bacteroidetes bacterium]|nr:hypothetical protein [Bacteroidota bacterium]
MILLFIGFTLQAQEVVTIEDVAAAVEKHIMDNTNDGVYKLDDKVGKQQLSLKHTGLHKSKLMKMSDEVFVMCADFISVDSSITYDVDYIVAGKKGSLKTTSMMLHKQGDDVRHSWEKDGDYYKMKRDDVKMK